MYQKFNNRLAGQTAIVTGSSSGIGSAVALALAKEGANLVINYSRDEAGANKIVDAINSDDLAGTAIALHADVSKEDQVQEMFKKSIEHFGTIDILVNNAGLQRDFAVQDMSLADWQMVIDINLTGQFLCAREAIREFLKRGPRPEVSVATGKIICMSSVHEVIPWGGHVNYAASKGGVMMLMKSMAQELGSKKIRINSIAPGAIKTPINTHAWDTPAAETELLKLIPYNRVGEATDIGAVAAWLASDESDYIHGTTIFVDGGMTLYPGFYGNG
ncbi:MAG: short-chain dehydrogenase/reductase [Chitinophagaceae bacterium]|nr:short-chain dehydrogenase/reductase [Chitinophagaceae bacterium]